MKTVRKFTTFEDLKSCENKPVKLVLRLKKHADFEKAIKKLRLLT